MELLITVFYILVCIALIIVVLMQEGKSGGLGALSGTSDNTYWGKNKGRSKEGNLIKVTRVLAVLMIVISVVLNMEVL